MATQCILFVTHPRWVGRYMSGVDEVLMANGCQMVEDTRLDGPDGSVARLLTCADPEGAAEQLAVTADELATVEGGEGRPFGIDVMPLAEGRALLQEAWILMARAELRGGAVMSTTLEAIVTEVRALSRPAREQQFSLVVYRGGAIQLVFTGTAPELKQLTAELGYPLEDRQFAEALVRR